MSKPKEVTIYKRGSGQLYGDSRPYGGKLEALIEKEKGETRATTDYARAQILVGERLKELETLRGLPVSSTARAGSVRVRMQRPSAPADASPWSGPLRLRHEPRHRLTTLASRPRS